MASTEQLGHSEIAVAAATSAAALLAGAAPACPLCRTHMNNVAFRDNGCSLRTCANCGLFFVDPYPSMARQHQQVSSARHDEIDLLDSARRHQGERLYYDRHFGSIAEECAGAKSLLDVGCGTGHLLERLAERRDLYRAGIELNPDAAAFAARVAGCDIFRGPLENFQTHRQFDAITMVNVFSHIPSFDGMFRSLRSLLAPGGKLILRTTEMSANVSRWNQVHWGIPDDLHFMGLQTLDFISARYQFAIARHVRVAFEDELFQVSRWQQVGRSALQNVAKRIAIRIPRALSTLRDLYASRLGQRLFISFIVLTLIEAGKEA